MRIVAVVCLSVLVLACHDPLEPSDVGGVLLRTDAPAYSIEETDRAFVVDIPFTFTNATGETVYVPNCRGMAPPILQKRVGDEWVLAYVPVVLACLSAPIVIERDHLYSGTLEVRAWKGDNVAPKFRIAELNGLYRLVWPGPVHDYDDAEPGFGERLPDEHRTSNPFTLTVD